MRAEALHSAVRLNSGSIEVAALCRDTIKRVGARKGSLMIINDPGVKKTTDTDSGRYLVYPNVNTKEHLVHFEISSSNDYPIVGFVEEVNITDREGTAHIEYVVRSVIVPGAASGDPDYVYGPTDHISTLFKFLTVFDQYYGLPKNLDVSVSVVDGRATNGTHQ